MGLKRTAIDEPLKLNRLYKGDARELAERLSTQSISVTLTSPPYWGMKDYGVPGQIGWRQDYGRKLQRRAAP
jgi:DNA modification methylase